MSTMNTPRLLTQAEKDFFQEHFEPIPEEGILIWKKARNKFTAHRVGHPVGGSLNHNGYKVFSIQRPDTGKSQTYLLHRVMYWFYTGEEPITVDHINGDRTDNTIGNLRAATVKQNCVNVHNRNTSRTDYVGVTQNSSGKFVATINNSSKSEYLGSYSCPEDAHEVYKRRHLEIHGEFSPYKEEDIRHVKINITRSKREALTPEEKEQRKIDKLLATMAERRAKHSRALR